MKAHGPVSGVVAVLNLMFPLELFEILVFTGNPGQES